MAATFLHEQGFAPEASFAACIANLAYNHPGRIDKAERDVFAYSQSRSTKLNEAQVKTVVELMWRAMAR